MEFKSFKLNLGSGIDAVGPPKCGTCPTSCFGDKMPLGKRFENFHPAVRQKFEELRKILTEADTAYRSGRMADAGRNKRAAQDKIIEIIPLVPAGDFDLLAQTVSRMVLMHSGNEAVRAFIDAE
ncbi:MAG: hypothetical protein M1530_01125 [Candidatus Marsarchaeota archaeon]|nr:hypothetical protein [Candidatus Marsarchaeota archaeon]